MNTTPNGADTAAILSLSPSPSPREGAPPAAQKDGQQIDFTEIITQEIKKPEMASLVEAGLQEMAVVDAGSIMVRGKALPATAEFAAESVDELDVGDAGVLFSLLGLTIDTDHPGLRARPPAGEAVFPGPGPGGQPSNPLAAGTQTRPAGVPPGAMLPEDGDSSFAVLAQQVTGRQPQQSVDAQIGVMGAGGMPEGLAAADTAALDRDAALQLSGTLSAAGPAARPAQPAAVTASLEVPMGEASWERGLGEKILWMAGRSSQSASIQLNPRHLGPIDIQLSLQHDQASVTFSAQHAVVRDALEAAIPRLREMFADNNLQLVNVDVGQREHGGNPELAQPFHDRSAGDGSGSGDRMREGDGRQAEEPGPGQPGIRLGRGILDDYA